MRHFFTALGLFLMRVFMSCQAVSEQISRRKEEARRIAVASIVAHPGIETNR